MKKSQASGPPRYTDDYIWKIAPKFGEWEKEAHSRNLLQVRHHCVPHRFPQCWGKKSVQDAWPLASPKYVSNKTDPQSLTLPAQMLPESMLRIYPVVPPHSFREAPRMEDILGDDCLEASAVSQSWGSGGNFLVSRGLP